MKKGTAIKLSKSRFVAGVQCMKRLYWEVHNRDLLGPVDEATQAIFDQGNAVGELARTAFPGGVLVDESHFEHDAAVARTQKLLGQKKVPAIYEAAFIFDDVKVRVDILERLPRNKWRLIEVKSTTKVKDYHVIDSAVQRYVVEGCGLKIAQVAVMHLDRSYEHTGGAYDLAGLFAITPVNAQTLEFLPEIPGLLKAQKTALRRSKAPEVEPGKHCTEPYTCPFFDQCHDPAEEDWIGYLPRLSGKRKAELEELGVESIHDLPEDFSLTKTQRVAADAVRTGNPYYAEQLPSVLEQLEYPLFFMDFETFFPALPLYGGLRPYDHYAFQWSVHVKKRRGGSLAHYEYLARDSRDARKAFLSSLLDVLESSRGKGHIVVYNQGFESARLAELAAIYPKYGRRIRAVQGRLWDLLPVVRANCYHPEFQGSFSIKKVLPALVPDMSYDDLEIGEGSLAAIMFGKMIAPETPNEERNQIEQALLAYCLQDTMAMARLLDVLHQVDPLHH